MSGQNAKRAENFDSLDNRLDSILDALNALGDAPSSAGAVAANTRPLQAVPDLDDNAVEESVVETSVDSLTPPAIPTVAPEADTTAAPAEPFESQLDVLAASSGSDASVTPPQTPDLPSSEQRPELTVVPATPAPVFDVPEVPDMPEPPVVAAFQQVLDAPEPLQVPELPAIPEIPLIPATPAVAEAPAVEAAPPVAEVVETPAVPEVVEPPAFETPAVPEVVETPAVPEVVEPPAVPEAPAVESMAFELPAVPEVPEPPAVESIAFEPPAVPEVPEPPAVESMAFEPPAVPEVLEPAAFEAPAVPEVPEPAAFEAPAVPEVVEPVAFETPDVGDNAVGSADGTFGFDVPPVPQVAEASVFETPTAEPSVFEAPADTFEAPSVPEVPEASAFDAPDTPFSEWTTPAAPVESDVATPSDTPAALPDFDLPAQDDATAFTAETPPADDSTPDVDRPMSIFRTAGSDPAPAPTPAAAPATEEEDEWVSHHIIEPQRDHGLFDEVPSASAAPAAPTQLEGDALWHVETYPEDIPAPVESSAIESPSVDEEQSGDLWNTVTETEEMLSTLDPMMGLDGGSELFEPSEDLADTGGSVSTGLALVSDHDVISDEDLTPKYGTDEDLPIPDFTGVYDETPSNWTVPGDDPVASAEGSITQTTAMMRRDELDRLRPAGEVVEEAQSTGAGQPPKLVLLVGIVFVLVTLALLFREEILGFI